MQASVDKLRTWQTHAEAELAFLQGGASGIAGVPPTNRCLDFPLSFVLPFDAANFTAAAVARAGNINMGHTGAGNQPSLEEITAQKERLEGKIKAFQQSAGMDMPRGLEPSRGKTHWDYVLQEMSWMVSPGQHSHLSRSRSSYLAVPPCPVSVCLPTVCQRDPKSSPLRFACFLHTQATDFARERLWKLSLAGRVARAVMGHHDQELAGHQKQLAKQTSALVAQFWAGIRDND